MDIDLLTEKIGDILNRIRTKEGNLKSASITIEIHFSPVGEVDIHYLVRQREPIKN